MELKNNLLLNNKKNAHSLNKIILKKYFYNHIKNTNPLIIICINCINSEIKQMETTTTILSPLGSPIKTSFFDDNSLTAFLSPGT